MPIHLTVKTHGLHALVPSPNDNRLVSLMCQAPDGMVPRQTAYVRFKRENYSESNRRLPTEPSPRSRLQHIELNRERLSIVGNVVAADATLQIDRKDNPRSNGPTGEDDKSFIWLPSVDDLAPGHGAIKSGYFNDVENVTPRLLARLDFTQGRLRTAGVERIQVPFRNGRGEEIRKPMARELVLELDIDDDHFVLRSDPFGGVHDPANDLLFEGDGNVEIVIGNEAADDIHRETPPIEDIDVLAEEAAKEAVFYFSLCQDPPDDPFLPRVATRPGMHTFCYHQIYDSVAAVDDVAPPLLARAVQNEQPAPWSMYAFIAVDNDLRRVGLADLGEMERGNSVNVVAQIDDPCQTRRLVLGPSGFTPASDTPLGQLNSGKPEVLTDFLVSAKALRPADNTIVVLASHGKGLLDFQFGQRSPANGSADEGVRQPFLAKMEPFLDGLPMLVRKLVTHVKAISLDMSAGDFLDNEELEKGFRDALKQDGPFDIIGLDACLMGLVEIAYQLRLCGNYFVASQEDLAAEGWPYDKILEALPNAPSTRDAATAIVDAFAATAGHENGRALSAVDLQAIPSVARALDELGGILNGAMQQHLPAIDRARNDTRAMAHIDYIDLRGFVDALGTHLGAAIAEDGARERMLATASAVLNELNKVLLKPKESNGGGLSVYVPTTRVAPEYHELALSKDAPRWHDFVTGYGASFG